MTITDRVSSTIDPITWTTNLPPIKRWYSLPTSTVNNYNITPFGHHDEFVLARHENVFNPNNTCPAYIVTGNPSKRTSSVELLKFFNTDNSDMVLGQTRDVCSVNSPIIEDLRSATCATGTDETLVTGVGLVAHTAGRLATETYAFEPYKSGVRVVTKIKSPRNSQIEKNWLFLRHSPSRYTVFYDTDSTTGNIIIYSWKRGSDTLVERREIRFDTPGQWTANNTNHTSKMRMSAICAVPLSLRGSDNAKTYFLLFHTKDTKSLKYRFYGVFLDEEYNATFYVTSPLFHDIKLRIFFIMNMTIDESRGELQAYTGICDEIGGVMIYDWDKISNSCRSTSTTTTTTAKQQIHVQ
jgi:hypothetical protein